MSTNTPQTQVKPGTRRTIVAALLIGTALGAGGVAIAISAQPSLAAAVATAPLSLPPVAAQAGFATLVEKVKPAVVQIATSGQQLGRQEDQNNQDDQTSPQMPDLQMPNLPQGPFGDVLRQYFGRQNNSGTEQQVQPEEHALGSGFIIDPAGYIVTNNHVVDGAHDISVTLTDGNKYSAKVVGRDAKNGPRPPQNRCRQVASLCSVWRFRTANMKAIGLLPSAILTVWAAP